MVLCFRPVVLAYNIPGVRDLVLSREQVVGIYNGSLRYWNDSSLQVSVCLSVCLSVCPSCFDIFLFHLLNGHHLRIGINSENERRKITCRAFKS